MGELVPHNIQDTGTQEQGPADLLIDDKGAGPAEPPVQGNLFGLVTAAEYRPGGRCAPGHRTGGSSDLRPRGRQHRAKSFRRGDSAGGQRRVYAECPWRNILTLGMPQNQGHVGLSRYAAKLFRDPRLSATVIHIDLASIDSASQFKAFCIDFHLL